MYEVTPGLQFSLKPPKVVRNAISSLVDQAKKAVSGAIDEAAKNTQARVSATVNAAAAAAKGDQPEESPAAAAVADTSGILLLALGIGALIFFARKGR